MKISKTKIKRLVRESIRNIIAEGVQDTVARAVGLTDPDKIEQIRIASEKPYKLQKPDLIWIAKFYMSPKGSKSEEPIKDIVAAIKDFKRSKKRIQQIGKAVDINQYESPKDLAIVTNYSEGYLHDSLLEKEAQKVYQNSEWQIWMPITREASCTLGSGTSWCTALRSKGNNLFYSYIMRRGVTLYYVIYVGEKNIDKSISKMALGVIEGKVAFAENEGDGHGGITVDLANYGVTRERFIRSVDSNASQRLGSVLIQEVENHSKAMGGKHIALSTMEKLISDPMKLKNENRGKTKEVVLDFVKVMLEFAEAHEIKISKEVLIVIRDLITVNEKDVLRLQRLEMHRKCVDLKIELNSIFDLLPRVQHSDPTWKKTLGPCIDKKTEKLIFKSLAGFLYQAFYAFFEGTAKRQGYDDLDSYIRRKNRRDTGDMSFSDIYGDIMYEYDDIDKYIWSLDDYTLAEISESFIENFDDIDIFIYPTGYQSESELPEHLFLNPDIYDVLC